MEISVTIGSKTLINLCFINVIYFCLITSSCFLSHEERKTPKLHDTFCFFVSGKGSFFKLSKSMLRRNKPDCASYRNSRHGFTSFSQ